MLRDEALYKAILDHIPDQAWLKDRDSRYVHVNEAFRKACELSLDKLGLTPTAALVPYAQRHGLLEEDAAVFPAFTDSAESSAAAVFP